MGHRYSFKLADSSKAGRFPGGVIIGRDDTETVHHVLLKLLGFVMFYRERLQIEPRLHDDNIPFVPDLVQLDYQLRPVLWVECGECSIRKLDKLAVKVPEAAIWILKKSKLEMEGLLEKINKAGLRQGRYHVLSFHGPDFEELVNLTDLRNELILHLQDMEEGLLQLDYNGLWHELEFEHQINS